MKAIYRQIVSSICSVILFCAAAAQSHYHRQGVRKIDLHAVSDAGMPVYYYVKEGPALIQGNTLLITTIPPRAKFPLKITVVAWQYGRSVDPKLKSALPVEHSFFITN